MRTAEVVDRRGGVHAVRKDWDLHEYTRRVGAATMSVAVRYYPDNHLICGMRGSARWRRSGGRRTATDTGALRIPSGTLAVPRRGGCSVKVLPDLNSSL